MKGKINIITLGCSKNLVDSEYLLRQFYDAGYEVMHDGIEEKCDVVILNTCGFILDAKEESVNEILEQLERKKSGDVGKVIVMGCLSERYRDDLLKELPDVDGFFGVWDHKEIVEAVGIEFRNELFTDRYLTTPDHYAYLKISEGCDRQCSFCAIPGIRGKQRSRSIDDLRLEAENLVDKGVVEIILIAQDLSNYGSDIYKERKLGALLESLLDIPGLEWIRLHYAYPTGFPEDVIDIMAREERVCSYLDIPIQHVNDRILKAMRRGHGREELEQLLQKFRKDVPDVALRTTVMVGYPGETEEEFNELLEFVREIRFERLGVFTYSHEDDTPAAGLVDDIPEDVKRMRADKIMTVQQEISFEKNEAKLWKYLKVIVDSHELGGHYLARTEYDSPEVDNDVLIYTDEDLELGGFYEVEIVKASEFELEGIVIANATFFS